MRRTDHPSEDMMKSSSLKRAVFLGLRVGSAFPEFFRAPLAEWIFIRQAFSQTDSRFRRLIMQWKNGSSSWGGRTEIKVTPLRPLLIRFSGKMKASSLKIMTAYIQRWCGDTQGHFATGAALQQFPRNFFIGVLVYVQWMITQWNFLKYTFDQASVSFDFRRQSRVCTRSIETFHFKDRYALTVNLIPMKNAFVNFFI